MTTIDGKDNTNTHITEDTVDSNVRVFVEKVCDLVTFTNNMQALSENNSKTKDDIKKIYDDAEASLKEANNKYALADKENDIAKLEAHLSEIEKLAIKAAQAAKMVKAKVQEYDLSVSQQLQLFSSMFPADHKSVKRSLTDIVQLSYQKLRKSVDDTIKIVLDDMPGKSLSENTHYFEQYIQDGTPMIFYTGFLPAADKQMKRIRFAEMASLNSTADETEKLAKSSKELVEKTKAKLANALKDKIKEVQDKIAEEKARIEKSKHKDYIAAHQTIADAKIQQLEALRLKLANLGASDIISGSVDATIAKNIREWKDSEVEVGPDKVEVKKILDERRKHTDFWLNILTPKQSKTLEFVENLEKQFTAKKKK